MTRSPERRRHRRAGLAGLAAWVAVAWSWATPGFAADYHLGPQDRVRIKLVEWRPGTSEAIEWRPLTDEYEVAASGAISLPLLGEFKANGRTPGQLGVDIAVRLQEVVGLTNRPEASVEVVSYRPVYVLGAVERPGEYKFRPDLTALQAVGVAGGIYRPADGGLLRLDRDRITATAGRDAALLDWQHLAVRKARLEAERAGGTDVPRPAGLSGPDVDRMIRDERELARSLDVRFKTQVQAAEQLRDLLDAQITALEQKIVSQDRQVDVSRRELQSYQTLAQGLAMASKTFSLERALAETTSRRLDYEMALLTARQDRRKAQQSVVDAQNERSARILRDLADVSAQFDTAQSRLDRAEELVTEAAVLAPFAVLNRQRAGDRGVTYRVVRRSANGASGEEAADETTVLAPGDVLRVDTPVPTPSTVTPGEQRARQSARTQ